MFVSEPLKPDDAGFNAAAMAGGTPGLPRVFLWRKQRLPVSQTLRSWKDTAPCRNGSDERYVNRHWFECALESGETALIYFERRRRPGTSATQRWFLYSIEPPSASG